jgi:vitamin-K-epoxide reductase (warfarin-sensitive)
MTKLVILSVFGLFLSLYALYVEFNAHEDENFIATCDISSHVSCSKVFLSKYGKIFSHVGLVHYNSLLDQPNAFYGVIFYVIFGVLSLFTKIWPKLKSILMLLSVISMLLSSYLSIILTFILNDVCIVCYGTYLCNIMIFLLISNANNKN